MAINVGELEAILKLRDDMTPQLQAAQTEIKALDNSLKSVATTETREVVPALEAGDAAIVEQTGLLATMRTTLNEVAAAEGLTFSALGLIGSAGAALGAGYVGWNVGRMIADFLNLDKILGQVGSALMGHNLAEEEAAAKQDVINKALRDGAPAGISYADAIKYNNEQFAIMHAFMGPILNDHEQYLRNKRAIEQAERDAAEALRKHTEEVRRSKEEHDRLIASLKETEHGLDGVGLAFMHLETLGEHVTVKVHTLKEEIDDLGRIGLHASANLLSLGGALDPNMAGAVTYGGMAGGLPNVSPSGKLVGLDSVTDKTTKWSDAIHGVSTAFRDLGVVAGGELGKMDRSIAHALSLLTAGPTAVIGGFASGALAALGRIGAPSQAELQSRADRDSFMGQFAAQLHDVATPQGLQSVSDHGFADMITKVGGALADTGHSASEADRIIGHMLDAKTPAQFAEALKPINHALDLQSQAQSDLNDLMQKYHLTISELGPAWSHQQLDQQAQQLFKDYEELKAAGVDVSVVTQHMSADVNDYLHNALKTGTEVPMAMRPMLEQMAKLGQLTDENGNVITDLGTSGVTFSKTMTQGFQDVVDSIKELSVTIAHDLAHAFDTAASHAGGLATAMDRVTAFARAGAVMGSVLDIAQRGAAQGAATGGLVTAFGIQRFAGGGVAGSDTVPALLTPGEMVLNAAQQAALFGGTGVIDNRIYLDGAQIYREMKKYEKQEFLTRGKRPGG